MTTKARSFTELSKNLPKDYCNEVITNAPLEVYFNDEEKHWYSPFILYAAEEVEQYQPDFDSDLSGYMAIGSIGSNGGMETYLMSLQDFSIWVADLIAGKSSLVKVSASYAELKSQVALS